VLPPVFVRPVVAIWRGGLPPASVWPAEALRVGGGGWAKVGTRLRIRGRCAVHRTRKKTLPNGEKKPLARYRTKNIHLKHYRDSEWSSSPLESSTAQSASSATLLWCIGTKYTSSSSSKVVDAAESASAAFACFITWNRAPRLGVPRPVVLGTGAVVADAAGVLFPDAGGESTSDPTAAGLLPTGGGGCTSDTAAGAVDNPASVAKAAAVPAGPDDISGGDKDKSIPAAAISLRACILRQAIASGVSRISEVLKTQQLYALSFHAPAPAERPSCP